jgi:ATP synthase protein I
MDDNRARPHMAAPPLKPIRRVIRWQLIVTVGLALVAWPWAGVHGALSAALGGVVNITAVAVYAGVLWISNPTSAGGTVAALFRAEAFKILVIVGELWLVLTAYKSLVPAAFFATFVITVLLFRLALLDRN